jgi:ABC-type transport system involved in multi-copper enzyme maturation permease subunit
MNRHQMTLLWTTAKETALGNILSYTYCVCILLTSFLTLFMIWLLSYFKGEMILEHVTAIFLFTQMIPMLYISMRTNATFSGELEKHTMDILISLPIKRWALFTGKLLGIILIVPFLILIPIGLFVIILNIVIGTLPNILCLIIIQFTALMLLSAISIVPISALISIIFKKIVYSLTASASYLMVMIITSPTLLQINDASQYHINYALAFAMPYYNLMAGMISMQYCIFVEPGLYLLSICYIITVGIIGTFVFRRLEL